MAIFESFLTVILKAFAFVTTSSASTVAYEALISVMNFILKLAGNIGIGTDE